MNVLRLKQLRLLAQNNAIKSVLVNSRSGGFQIEVTTNSDQTAILFTERGGLRVFPNPETALKLLRENGILSCSLDLSQWMAETPKMASGH